MNDIGSRLKNLRRQARLSLCELAEYSGISKGYISSLEAGKQDNPSIRTLEKLAPFLQVNIEDLMKGNLDHLQEEHKEQAEIKNFPMLVRELAHLRKEVSILKSLLLRSTNSLETNTPSVQDNNIEEKISDFLLQLKITPKLKGYYFLREAIRLVYSDSTLIEGITKQLYPMIAKKFNTTPARAERAIRHAIETSWYRIERNDFYAAYNFDSRPTNTEFIGMVADQFQLKQKINF